MSNRRRFIANILTVAAGTLGLAACAEEQESTGQEKISQVPDRDLFYAFVDTIVPVDEDPGAVEAGVADELLAWFISKPEEGEKTSHMLMAIDQAARKRFDLPFQELGLINRSKILKAIKRSRNVARHPARDTIQRLRARIVRGFYLSPTGRAMLGYAPPFPAGYPDYNLPPA
jgi:hypothetical protein